MSRKYKILILLIIILTVNVNAKKTRLIELSVGDTININDLHSQSTEIYGDIFNGKCGSKFIRIENSEGLEDASIIKKSCLDFESLASYYFPDISIDNTKFDSSRVFYKADRSHYNFFGLPQDYIDHKYMYGIIKLCWTVETKKSNIKLIDKIDFPIINNSLNYKLLLDETAVLRFKKNNETHYVSSITTGDCLFQVFVNRAELCFFTDNSQLKIGNDDNFIRFSIYKSHIIIASENHTRENHVNKYFDEYKNSLLNLRDIRKSSNYNILSLPQKTAVIKFELHLLPDLPKSLNKQIQESILYPTLLAYLKPGDIINIDDLKNINSSITIDNILVDVPDGTINSYFALKYTDCYEYNENDAVNLDFVTYKSYSHYPPESYYKFDVFDETVKRRHYGVDRRYLNRNYKCAKTIICSELQRQKLIIPTVRVVNLGRKTNNNSNIFDSENLVLRYVMNNETHYVTRTEKGNCLFQALIYPNDDDKSKDNTINSPLVYIGKILSATNDRILEYRAENYINNLTTDLYKTLMNVVDNHSTRASFFSEFFRKNYYNTLINIYLDKLY